MRTSTPFTSSGETLMKMAGFLFGSIFHASVKYRFLLDTIHIHSHFSSPKQVFADLSSPFSFCFSGLTIAHTSILVLRLSMVCLEKKKKEVEKGKRKSTLLSTSVSVRPFVSRAYQIRKKKGPHNDYKKNRGSNFYRVKDLETCAQKPTDQKKKKKKKKSSQFIVIAIGQTPW